MGYKLTIGTLSFLGYSIPATGHAYDISIPDSSMYLGKDMYLAVQGMVT